jgi:hypothetical protein
MQVEALGEASAADGAFMRAVADWLASVAVLAAETVAARS